VKVSVKGGEVVPVHTRKACEGVEA